MKGEREQREIWEGGEKQRHGEERSALTAEVVPLQHTRCIVMNV